MDADALIEQLPDAVIVADREGVIRVWNAAAQALFGHSAQEAIGQSLDLIIPQRLRDAHWKAYDAALADGRTKHGRKVLTTRSVHRSGEKLYVDLSFAIVLDEAGEATGAVAVARAAAPREVTPGKTTPAPLPRESSSPDAPSSGAPPHPSVDAT